MPCVIDLRQSLPVRHLRVRMCAYVIVSGWVVYQWCVVDRTWCTKRASGERSSFAWSGSEAGSGGGRGEVVRPPRVDCPAPNQPLSSPLSSSPSLLPPSCVFVFVCVLREFAQGKKHGHVGQRAHSHKGMAGSSQHRAACSRNGSMCMKQGGREAYGAKREGSLREKQKRERGMGREGRTCRQEGSRTGARHSQELQARRSSAARYHRK